MKVKTMTQKIRFNNPVLLVFILIFAVLGVILLRQGSAATYTEQAKMADGFVDSIGINTHVNYGNTNYNNYATFKSSLQEVGIRHIRDYPGPNYVSKFNDLAAAGIKTNAIMGVAKPTSWFPYTLDDVVNVVKANPNAFDGVEGPNEWDINGGGTWAADLRSYTQQLWNKMKADPVTATKPVWGPSITWASNTPALGDISSWVDGGNMHPYPGGNMPSISRTLDDVNASKTNNVAGKPVILTETGYHNAINTTNGHLPASEKAAGIYFPRIFLYDYEKGIPRTFTYEFLDEGSSSTDAEMSFGIVRSDWSRKPAFNAMKNMIGLLKDPGTTFTPQALSYSLSGDSQTHHLLLQKRDGTFWLAVWQETSVYNTSTRTDIDPPDVPVTLDLGSSTAAAINRYMPNTGAAALSATANSSTVSFNSSEAVTLLEIKGLGSGTPAPPDTTPPTVSMASPANGSTVSGTVLVSAAASDDVGVSKVEFYVDNALKSTGTASSFNWDTTSATGGSHTLMAKAYDAAGNVSSSNVITVTVNNAVVGQPDLIVTAVSWTPASPIPGDGVRFTATVKNQGMGSVPSGVIIGVAFRVNGTLISWSDTFTSGLAPGASVSLTANSGPTQSAFWLATAGSYSVEAYVDDINRIPESDEANNKLVQSITVSSIGVISDTTAPVVSIQSPASGGTVSGNNVSIKASATDNVSVSSIAIYIDGQLYASAQSSSLSTNWNTRTKRVSAGSHTITVKAYDSSNNVGTTTITVTVSK